MEDLQRVLEKVVTEQAKKPLTRRFIVTEGLFENVGDMVDLPKVVCRSALKAVSWLIQMTDRAQAPLQVPSHSRRDLVIWRSRQDWARHH